MEVRWNPCGCCPNTVLVIRGLEWTDRLLHINRRPREFHRGLRSVGWVWVGTLDE